MSIWADAIDNRTGEQVRLFVGAGMVANRHGDIYGTSPARIIRAGMVVIDGTRLEGALRAGWRETQKPAGMECDPDFAWIQRDWEDRPA